MDDWVGERQTGEGAVGIVPNYRSSSEDKGCRGYSLRQARHPFWLTLRLKIICYLPEIHIQPGVLYFFPSYIEI